MRSYSYAADNYQRILKTPDVAIYQVANADYCRLFSATSDQAKVLGKSVKYSEMTDMTDMLNNKQVYINKTMNEDYPLMASAIYRNDKPLEIIMIWGLSFEKMTQYQANLLTVLGFMIYNSVDRARALSGCTCQYAFYQRYTSFDRRRFYGALPYLSGCNG